MFKSIIKKKKVSVFSDTSQTEEVNDAFKGKNFFYIFASLYLYNTAVLLDITCKDCQEQGHASKNYYKCKLYKEITADDGNNSFIYTTTS